MSERVIFRGGQRPTPQQVVADALAAINDGRPALRNALAALRANPGGDPAALHPPVMIYADELHTIHNALATMRQRMQNPTPPPADGPVTIYIGADGQLAYLDPDAHLLESELTVDIITTRFHDAERHEPTGDERP